MTRISISDLQGLSLVKNKKNNLNLISADVDRSLDTKKIVGGIVADGCPKSPIIVC